MAAAAARGRLGGRPLLERSSGLHGSHHIQHHPLHRAALRRTLRRLRRALDRLGRALRAPRLAQAAQVVLPNFVQETADLVGKPARSVGGSEGRGAL